MGGRICGAEFQQSVLYIETQPLSYNKSFRCGMLDVCMDLISFTTAHLNRKPAQLHTGREFLVTGFPVSGFRATGRSELSIGIFHCILVPSPIVEGR